MSDKPTYPPEASRNLELLAKVLDESGKRGCCDGGMGPWDRDALAAALAVVEAARTETLYFPNVLSTVIERIKAFDAKAAAAIAKIIDAECYEPKAEAAPARVRCENVIEEAANALDALTRRIDNEDDYYAAVERAKAALASLRRLAAPAAPGKPEPAAPPPVVAKPPVEPVVRVTQQEFDSLLEYSTSLPTLTTIGKRWKCDRNWGRKLGPDPQWLMGEYVEKDPPDPKNVGILWRRIEIVVAS